MSKIIIPANEPMPWAGLRPVAHAYLIAGKLVRPPVSAPDAVVQ